MVSPIGRGNLNVVRYCYPEGNGSPKKFVECRTLLLLRLLFRGPNEIFVELARERVQPTPIVGNRLKNHRISMSANSDLLASKAEIFWQSDRL